MNWIRIKEKNTIIKVIQQYKIQKVTQLKRNDCRKKRRGKRAVGKRVGCMGIEIHSFR